MNTIDILKNKISELTDYDTNLLTRDTKLSEIELVSLDYVAIQIALKKEKNLDLDLNKMANSSINTIGELVDLVEN